MPKIQIVAFRGTGGFDNPKYKDFEGLIKAGHVGIKFADDEIIYGFHPSPEAEEEAGGEEKLLDLLLNHVAQEGSWQNDTVIFEKAYALSLSGERTKVWELSQELEQEEYKVIKELSRKWYTETTFRAKYNLPNRDGSFNKDEYNCAVFPKLLGIKLPTNNGKVAVYIEEMKKQGAQEWHPS